MGTRWHVSYVTAGEQAEQEAVNSAITDALDAVNASMSNYQESSEISRFNAAQPGVALPLSDNFARVLEAALDVGQRSDGAYDVTVSPLVRLWGFGPAGPVLAPPTSVDIARARETVGQALLHYDAASRVLAKKAPVELDFSSLAKGYAVDLVAAELTTMGIRNFLVEVGGEMKLAGMSGRGDRWRVAIEAPQSGGRTAAAAISLTDRAIATSGDYRNYFEADGQRYSHSIDPRTGYPVTHDLVSVTVVHDSALFADAWATALMVLGGEVAMQLAEAEQLAVYFIRRIGEDFVHSHSAAFAPYLNEAGEPTEDL